MTLETRQKRWMKRVKPFESSSWSVYRDKWNETKIVSNNGTVKIDCGYWPPTTPIFPKPKIAPGVSPDIRYTVLLERVERLEDMLTKILDKLASLEQDVNPSVRGTENEKNV